MNKLTTWGMHAAVSVLTAFVATGAIYEFAPHDHQRQGYALVMVMAYLLGVKMPTPRS